MRPVHLSLDVFALVTIIIFNAMYLVGVCGMKQHAIERQEKNQSFTILSVINIVCVTQPCKHLMMATGVTIDYVSASILYYAQIFPTTALCILLFITTKYFISSVKKSLNKYSKAFVQLTTWALIIIFWISNVVFLVKEQVTDLKTYAVQIESVTFILLFCIVLMKVLMSIMIFRDVRRKEDTRWSLYVQPKTTASEKVTVLFLIGTLVICCLPQSIFVFIHQYASQSVTVSEYIAIVLEFVMLSQFATHALILLIRDTDVRAFYARLFGRKRIQKVSLTRSHDDIITSEKVELRPRVNSLNTIIDDDDDDAVRKLSFV